MKPLPKNYDHKERERHWQDAWAKSDVYHFRDDKPREETFVIDTPPPTVSGVLHMGHIFSYTQADFVARYQRMSGKDVFYPMGFDDNGLPTERLVEKTLNIKGAAMPREEFVAKCREVVKSAEEEFRNLFKSTALSVDWELEYQTISDDVRKLSQASFIDLMTKKDKNGNPDPQAYRDFRPTYWDWVDKTAIASAEIEEKEQPGIQCTIPFGLINKADWIAYQNSPTNGHNFTFDNLEKVSVMTTRPELLGACVALMCHPDDKEKYTNKVAISPLFTAVVPIVPDEKVDKEKGTGFVMCCSWGDDTDKEWIAKYALAWRPLLGTEGRLNPLITEYANQVHFVAGRGSSYESQPKITSYISHLNCLDISQAIANFSALKNSKLIRDIKNENSSKGKALKLLETANLLLPQGEKGETIIHKTQMVKCAERSGTPIEIIPTHQWFVRIVDKKEALLAKGAECIWYPEYMRVRLNQWIEGLKEDWCISRQRFFGVPFPVWYGHSYDEMEKNQSQQSLEIRGYTFVADYDDELPIDPINSIPKGFKLLNWPENRIPLGPIEMMSPKLVEDIKTKEKFVIWGDRDVMDTWATSSISPQINAKTLEKCKLFPADLRPQAHEIIRTWAFYTIVKAHLHANVIPWKSLMISGWCLAADKSKMSKSKGNVVTPVALIEEKGSDAVRYWASTSRLATDTAFSEDLLKIGRKLVTKLWNASNFAALNLSKLEGTPTTAAEDVKKGIITEPLDLWILSWLNTAVKKATEEFERFEYCDARVAIEDFFWNGFCDNYLELVKARAYGESTGSQQSALYTLHHCLNAILRLFAPFVPHITEELYSHIFDGRGSVHTRGNWPQAADYPFDQKSFDAGKVCVDVLNIVRKVKSEAGLSIKFPVKEVAINAGIDFFAYKGLLPDLKAAANADAVVPSQDKNLPYVIDEFLSVGVTLAKIEEQKRNPDQKEQEKLEGKIVHGPGNPDLSKHVVKVQVNSLPDSLQKQK